MRPQVRAAYKNACGSLVLLFGPEGADELIEQTLRLAGLVDVVTADDLLRFAMLLEEQQGAVSSVGRAAKVVALMQGAKPP